ncbi:HlyC/CorC family transporter [Thiomicrospira sp. ALE5]|uniref:HlyC/CorC family transporter n=1 Tax=Thiomicrospira sp. ALE5 TaxID=748650 RepID=UPI0008E9113A|nr:transporter associated domain-containing protein [Thiomicrospira sp. ALE5]SFR53803.1 magnesium and cobalt transporter [Thiomicrospira sp. ALE5]
MSESDSSSRSSWIDRIARVFSNEPEDLDDLITLLKDAQQQGLIDHDAFFMIEGVLDVNEMRVRDIMVPRPQVDVIDESEPLDVILSEIARSAHSRYPVISETKDQVLGILLAKDVLKLMVQGQLNSIEDLRSIYRKPVFIPESKRVNVLLREFKSSHNHMALVVDEYAGLAGVVTIEDVLEQIVGEIEDEHDEDEEALIKAQNGTSFKVQAITPLEVFAETFKVVLDHDSNIETLGGLIATHLGHVPQKGEELVLQGFNFRVLKADSRRVHLFLVKPVNKASDAGSADIDD